MELKEITDEALKLPKKEKTALINALLESMSAKGTDDGSPKMPVFQALDTFGKVYRELKGTDLTDLMSKRNFGTMKKLLTAILQKIVEGSSGDIVVSSQTLVLNLESLMRAVAAMPNRWYFENRFTPDGMATDFDKIYSQIKNNSGHERAKRACDYL